MYMRFLPRLAFGLFATGAHAQTIDQATFDKAWAVCSRLVEQGGPMLFTDAHQVKTGMGPGARVSRWSTPAWDEVCEPVFQEHLARENAKTPDPAMEAARAAARALGAVK